MKNNINIAFKGLEKSLSKIEKKRRERIHGFMEKTVIDLEKTMEGVILDYNVGRLERYPGDFQKRVNDNNNKNRNMPLIDTGALMDGIEGNVKIRGKSVIGYITASVPYFDDIDEGTDKIKPYLLSQITLERAKSRIRRRFNRLANEKG
ncbi:MAG: hypothetical protein ACRCX2_01920 [Paraclostridium sp.]